MLIEINGTIDTKIEEGSWLTNFISWLEGRDETFGGSVKIITEEELDNENDNRRL